MSERDIQNEIRLAANDYGRFFRVNVGQGWVGNIIRKSANTITLGNYRPLTTGVPKGFSDLIGLTEITITPDMVGQKIAVFTALEVKSKKGIVSPSQKTFIEMVKARGGLAAIVRSVEDMAEALQWSSNR